MVTSSESLKEILIRYLRVEKAKIEAMKEGDLLLEGLGLDSIDMMELIVLLRKEYGIAVENANGVKEAFKTLGSLIKYIEEKKAKK